MKPKNKFQQRVAELSKKLSPITQTQAKWGYRNCIEHIGRRTAKGIISCLECGHSWQGEGELINTLLGCHCPNCQTKLKVETTRKRIFNDYGYLCIVTSYEEFQVLRFVYIDYRAKAGEKARYFHSEVIQLWLHRSGKHATIARLRPMSCFTDTWNFSSKLELRPNRIFYNAHPAAVYPRKKLIPKIKRSGYAGKFYGLTPFDLFHYILTENRAETLLKTNKTTLLKYFAGHSSRNITGYWASVRICIRNGYTVHDAQMWRDYIDLLRFFGKDLHNAKYVCPADLNVEHDRYVKKKRTFEEQERRKEDRKRALEDETRFNEMKARFFGVCFTDGHIQVRVLESVEEVMQEGDTLKHCVFTNQYHLKSDSLILSACVNGQKTETVEFSLSRMAVVQCRGKHNQTTEYHDQIINLVHKNRRMIKKRMAA